MTSTVDVSVTTVVHAAPARIRSIMFDPRQDPTWMAAVKKVEAAGDELHPGASVRRIGRFLGRTLRWTTVVTEVTDGTLDLEIVDGPMRGTVEYRIEPESAGARVTIRNTGAAPGFAPRWILAFAMRRALTADLARLKHVAEQGA